MTPASIISQVIQILTGSITGISTAMGTGIMNIVNALAFTGTGDNQTLSVLLVLALVFSGITLGFNLFRWGLNFITSFTQSRS